MTNLSRLLSHVQTFLRMPTAPFREQWMMQTVDRMLSGIPGLKTGTDRFGNRIARLKRGCVAEDCPVAVFVAHLDHPGFIFEPDKEGPGTGNTIWTLFEGGVRDDFFPGSPVRFFRDASDSGISGRILEAGERNPETYQRKVRVELNESAENTCLGMWDVDTFETSGDWLIGRACDDLAGCGMLIELLNRLCTEDRIDVGVVFTRAEEAGFGGTLCMLDEPELPALFPEHPVFISVEISSEREWIQPGDGAIIRVGDARTVFDSHTTNLMAELAEKQGLNSRRALMDGGTCEATPFCRAGYRAGGICVPVRHYHNMNLSDGTIVAEMISNSDLEDMTELAVQLSRNLPGQPAMPGRDREKLHVETVRFLSRLVD
jgi:putative aminopeptidase FrvX